jgi:predicted metalloprotease with PDZ domain
VANPYTLRDARDRLADVSDRAFADAFFDRYIEGRDVPDYARLLAPAGIVVRRRAPGAAWTGASIDAAGRVTAPQGLVPWGSPAFAAGLEHGDVVVAAGGRPFAADVLQNRKPGDKIEVDVRRVDGRTVSLSLTFADDPALQAVAVESTGAAPTPAQRAFRDAWLGPKRK